MILLAGGCFGTHAQALPASVMDAYAEEGSSLLRSRRMVGDYMQTGQESLASLVDQRSRLKVSGCFDADPSKYNLWSGVKHRLVEGNSTYTSPFLFVRATAVVYLSFCSNPGSSSLVR